MAKLILPEKITVGFNIRDYRKTERYGGREIKEPGTFDFNEIEISDDEYFIGFAIPQTTDHLNSLEKWRNKKINLKTLTNEPRTGYSFAFKIRHSSNYFGSGRIRWRIIHPEGFQFEITSNNLDALIHSTNIVNGEITNPCVLIFSSNGTSIALLSTNTEKYTELIKPKRIVNRKPKISDEIFLRAMHILNVFDNDNISYEDFLLNTNVLTYSKYNNGNAHFSLRRKINGDKSYFSMNIVCSVRFTKFKITEVNYYNLDTSTETEFRKNLHFNESNEYLQLNKKNFI